MITGIKLNNKITGDVQDPFWRQFCFVFLEANFILRNINMFLLKSI